MGEYPLRVVEAMVVNGRSLESTEGFVEDRAYLLEEEDRAVLWLLAWSETSRENRPRRVAELIKGERQLAGQVDRRPRDCSWANESVAGLYQSGLGIGD